jgi:hypothetical protein
MVPRNVFRDPDGGQAGFLTADKFGANVKTNWPLRA